MFDPITLTAISVGMSAIGGAFSFSGASKASAAQKQIAQLEMQAEAVRKAAMEADARRKKLEVIRNAQRARSLALTTATAQGAAQGSGLIGAYGQVAGQSAWNIAGINENLAFGRQLFDINSQISAQKMQIADASSTSALGAGISQFGGSLMNSMGGLNRIFGGGTGAGAPNMSSYGGFVRGIGSGGIY